MSDSITDADDTALDLLRTPAAGGRVVRGGVVRAIGFGISAVLGLATARLLLPHLGRDDFGRYATVSALLGIVAGITDAGLTAVGGRELALVRSGAERDRLLNNLLALRVLAASVGALAAVAFAALAGYDDGVIAATAIGGVGIVLISGQSMLTVPIWVDLRIVSLTALEVLRNLFMLIGVAALVAGGAGLVAFFGMQVAVAAALIPVTIVVARVGTRFTRGVTMELVMRLVRETVPLAIALAMSVLYVRVLVVLVSLLSSESETGLFGASFRIFEMLLGLPALVLSVALPVLAVASDEDQKRLRGALQSMTEAALLTAALFVVAIAILAEPVIRLIGEDEFIGAAPVLRVQALALVPLFLGQAWALGLIAARAQRAMAVANGLALVLVLVLGLALVPSGGAKAAAWVAVGAESALALFLWIGLRRKRPGEAPRLWFAWKVAIPTAAAAAVGYVLRDSPVVAVCVAVPVFVLIAVAVRAVPADVYHAFGLMRGKEDEDA